MVIKVARDVPDSISGISGTVSGVGDLTDELLQIHRLLEPCFQGASKDALDPLMAKLCDSLQDWMLTHKHHSDQAIQKAHDIFDADARGAASMGG